MLLAQKFHHASAADGTLSITMFPGKQPLAFRLSYTSLPSSDRVRTKRMEKRGHVMKSTVLKSVLMQSVIIVPALCLLGPDAFAQGPGVPTYDNNIASGDAGYSRTYEPTPDGGYTENTYQKDPNGINRIVEIRKYPKGSKSKSNITYHWGTYDGPNGSTINETMTVYGGQWHYTKEVIEADGSKTSYAWDDEKHWVRTAYTPAPSKTPTVEQAPTPALNQSTNAQAPVESRKDCWIDVKTGKHIPTQPIGASPQDYIPRDDHWTNPRNGKTYVLQPDGSWIDVQTGKPVPTTPIGSSPQDYVPGDDHWTNPRNGKTYVRVPCPPPPSQTSSIQQVPTPTQTAWAGPYFGGQMVKSWGHVVTTEKVASTGAISNQFKDNHDPFGGGINGGYDWMPWNNKVLVGVGLDADFPNEEVQHNFPGGAYLNSTVDFAALVRGRVGYLVRPNLLVYCLTGVSVADQHLQMNLGGATTDEHQPTPGFTAGAGVEWMITTASTGGPRGFLRAPSLFIEYTHTWWADAELNQPAASPAFNYSWTRESDMVSAGFRVRF